MSLLSPLPAGRLPGGLQIRPAEPADAAAIAALSAELGYAVTPDEAAERLARIAAEPEHAVFLAVGPAGRLGWVHVLARPVLLVVPPRAEIGGLVVTAGARGQGIGRALMAAAEEWARAHGCPRMMLRSNVVRRDAHAFYSRLGYREVKRSLVFERSLAAGD